MGFSFELVIILILTFTVMIGGAIIAIVAFAGYELVAAATRRSGELDLPEAGVSGGRHSNAQAAPVRPAPEQPVSTPPPLATAHPDANSDVYRPETLHRSAQRVQAPPGAVPGPSSGRPPCSLCARLRRAVFGA